MILGPRRVLGPCRVLGPRRVMGPLRVLSFIIYKHSVFANNFSVDVHLYTSPPPYHFILVNRISDPTILK